MDNPNSLDLLFKPKTIAILEAKEKLYYFLEGFKTLGYNLDNLYLISPTEDEIFGLKCYKSLEDIPESIDLFILAVRRDLLVNALKDVLSKKKVKFIHFFSAGMAEVDDEGVEIEKELKDILASYHDTRSIGPNCMGVYCPEGNITYTPAFPIESGHIGLVFHSGDLHSKMIIYSYHRYKLTFSKGVSIGNCLDLQIADFLEYYNQDEDIDIICVYFEGFSPFLKNEGENLLRTLRKMKKPVLFLRGGRTKRAQTAVITHTGSLGTSRKIWEAVFKQTFVIDSGTILDDLIDNTYLFNAFFTRFKHLPLDKQILKYPKGKNALVIVWSGGLGILDTDELCELGINLPLITGETKKRLMEVYPLRIGSLSNPLDLPWIARGDVFPNLSKAAVSDDINFVILESDAPLHWDKGMWEDYWANIKIIKEYVNSLDKIFILILPQWPHRNQRKYYQMLLEEGFIVYPTVRRAAKAFLSLYEYGRKVRALK